MSFFDNSSETYARFPDEVHDRVDFSHNHPALDVVNNLDSVTPYSTAQLGDSVDERPLIEKIVSGATPRGIDYIEDGIYFLGAGNIQQNWLDLEGVTLIEESVHKNTLSASQLSEGDVLVTMAGTIGRSCVYDQDDPANINQAIAKIEVNRDVLLPEYLSLYFNSEYGEKAFRKLRHDVSQPNINTEEIQQIPVIIPPVEDQRHIASSAYESVDQALALRNRKSELLQEAANEFLERIGVEIPTRKPMFFEEQETPTDTFSCDLEPGTGMRFEYLFHHRDLDAINLVDEAFELTTLEEICLEEIHRGEQPDYDEDGDVMVIKTAEIKNSYIDYENTRKVSEEFYENNPQAQIETGDILISSTGLGSLGKVDLFDKSRDAVVDGHLSIVRPNEAYDARFLVFYLRSYLGKVQFEKWFNGSSGQIELTPDDLGKFVVPSSVAFDLNSQKQIAEDIQSKYDEALDVDNQADDILDSMMTEFETAVTSD